MKMITYLCAILFIATSCGDDDDSATTTQETSTPPNVVGMNFSQSDSSFEDTYDRLRTALVQNENITIVAEVDHQANAQSAGLELNPTRVIFFGNPTLGTPLMQRNQQAGLDLPQRMLVYQDDNDDVYVGYNNTIFLDNRHTLNDVSTVNDIAVALSSLASTASDNDVTGATASSVDTSEGIITTLSNRNFADTYTALLNAINGNPNLSIIAELDHQDNAQSVDLQLEPSRVIIFGNPNLGTPLMQSSQTTALDLPQKMLVYQNDAGITQVSYNDVGFLRARHNISGEDDTLETIGNALQTLSNAATDN